MNKLNTPNGQMPIYLDDFRFIDDIYRSGIEAILKTFAKDINCIVWGCEETWEMHNVTINEGGIWYNNEYFYCPGIINLYVRDYVGFIIKELDTSQRLMGDGSVVNAQKLRSIEITTDIGPYFNELPKLRNLVFTNNSNWNIDFFYINNWSGYGTNPLKYRLILGGNFVQIRGWVTCSNFIAGTICIINRIDFRPLVEAKGLADVEGVPMIVDLDTNGMLSIELLNHSPQSIYIDIMYPLF